MVASPGSVRTSAATLPVTLVSLVLHSLLNLRVARLVPVVGKNSTKSFLPTFLLSTFSTNSDVNGSVMMGINKVQFLSLPSTLHSVNSATSSFLPGSPGSEPNITPTLSFTLLQVTVTPSSGVLSFRLAENAFALMSCVWPPFSLEPPTVQNGASSACATVATTALNANTANNATPINLNRFIFATCSLSSRSIQATKTPTSSG